MLTESLDGALRALATAFVENPVVEAELVARWLPRAVVRPALGELSADLLAASSRVLAELPAITREATGITALSPLFADARALPLLAWCAASTSRRDVRLAPLLVAASAHPELAERVIAIARDRVAQGPLLDALSSAPLIGRGDEL